MGPVEPPQARVVTAHHATAVEMTRDNGHPCFLYDGARFAFADDDRLRYVKPDGSLAVEYRLLPIPRPPVPNRWTLRIFPYEWEHKPERPHGVRVVRLRPADQPIRSLIMDYSMESLYLRYVTPDGERHVVKVHDPGKATITGRRVLIQFYESTDDGAAFWLFTRQDP